MEESKEVITIAQWLFTRSTESRKQNISRTISSGHTWLLPSDNHYPDFHNHRLAFPFHYKKIKAYGNIQKVHSLYFHVNLLKHNIPIEKCKNHKHSLRNFLKVDTGCIGSISGKTEIMNATEAVLPLSISNKYPNFSHNFVLFMNFTLYILLCLTPFFQWHSQRGSELFPVFGYY